MNKNNNHENLQKLGKLLKEIRERNKLNERELSSKINVSLTGYKKLEAGEVDENKTSYYQRLFVLKFLKEFNEDDAVNKKVLDDAYPKDKTFDNVKIKDISKDKKLRNKKNLKSLWNKMKFIVVLILVLIVIGGSITYIYSIVSSIEPKVAENETTLVKDEVLEPEKVVNKVEEPKNEIEYSRYEDGVFYYDMTKLEDPENYSVEIIGTDDTIGTYIEVVDADTGYNMYNQDAQWSTILKKNKKFTITDIEADRVQITLGYASNAKIYVNGIELDTHAMPDQATKVILENNAN